MFFGDKGDFRIIENWDWINLVIVSEIVEIKNIWFRFLRVLDIGMIIIGT